jgi:hypothetical protein
VDFDRIEFVRYRVTTATHGFWGECIDVRINGGSIIPLDEDGDKDLAGLPLKRLRAWIGEVDAEAGWQRRQVLRCICGDYGCDGATVQLRGTANEILWLDADGRTRQGRGARSRFDRDQWQSALAAPT